MNAKEKQQIEDITDYIVNGRPDMPTLAELLCTINISSLGLIKNKWNKTEEDKKED